MKKILFVCPTGDLNSGGERSNFELIKYLHENNYELFVVTAWQGEFNSILNNYKIKNLAGNYKWWAPWSDPQKTAQDSFFGLSLVRRAIDDFMPNVVVTNTFNIPWGALAASISNTPHIWIGREFPEGEFKYLDKKMNFINTFSNRIMANSKELARSIEKKYEVNVGHFYSYVDVAQVSLNTSQDELRIVSPNGITRRKNQLELLKAIAYLKKVDSNFNTRTIFIGHADEDYKNEIDEFILINKIEDLVEFVGFSNNPWSLVGKNDILIQTSLSESIGRTTTEAMKMGIPVIASNIPGHIEAFSLGGGTMYESENYKDLASKIKYAIKNRKELTERSKEIQELSLENLSNDACNKPFLNALEQVLGSENPMKELSQIDSYLTAFINNDLMQKSTLEKASEALSAKQSIIDRQRLDLEDVKNRLDSILTSRSYRMAKMPGRITRKIKLTKKSRRG